MSTYSINVGTITEALKKEDIYQALLDLPDNVQKKISPKDLRDAIFTSWASAAFKLTKPDAISTEYIGIDSSNPYNRDIKRKILLGKRTVGNLDVVNDVLLNTSDADIFFYNTKSDSASQDQTKITILAGTDSSLFYSAPSISASYSSLNNTINLELRNPSLAGGAINIYSETGRVGINGIAFPTVAETNATASSGKILKYYGTYPNGFLRWSSPDINTSIIGSTGTPTYIFGSSSYVNGYPLEFIEDDIVPTTIGGIDQGSSFPSNSFTGLYGNQNWPIVEVLRKLLYPYIEPVLTISATNLVNGSTFAEIGTTPSINLNFSITTFAREANEYIRDYYIAGSSTYSNPNYTINGFSFSALPGSTLNLVADGTTFSSQSGTVSYTLNVSNSWDPFSIPFPYGYSFSATASIVFYNPIVGAYQGTQSIDFDIVDGDSVHRTNSVLSIILGQSFSVDKKLIPQPGLSQSVNMDIDGYGHIYFAYPSSYGRLQKIKDPNGFLIHDITNLTYSAFTYSESVSFFGSSHPYFDPFYVYRTIATSSYFGIEEFEFVF